MATSGVETSGDFLLAIVTFIGIVLSASLIIWQINRQFKNALALQQQNFKDRFRKEIHSEFSDALHDCNHKFVKTDLMVASVPSDFSIYLFKKDNGLCPSPIKARDHLIRKSKSEASKSATRVMHLLEKYEIMLPRLTVAKLLIGEELQNLHTSFTNFHKFSVRYVPMEVPEEQIEAVGKKVVSLREIDADAIAEMEKLTADYTRKCTEFTSYIGDLRVIIQNELLGHLFDRELEGRKQRNNDYVIIKTDDDPTMVKLKSELLKDGVWGKALQRVYHGVNQYGMVDDEDMEDEPQKESFLN